MANTIFPASSHELQNLFCLVKVGKLVHGMFLHGILNCCAMDFPFAMLNLKRFDVLSQLTNCMRFGDFCNCKIKFWKNCCC